MKSLPNHLPQSKQDELQIIVDVICKNCDDVEKIILFGSYARGNYKEAKDLKANSKSGHISDYDILVVTKNKETALDNVLWSKISQNLLALNLSAHPKIITHDIFELNKKLSEGQYFFSDIKKEGFLLFDTEKFKFISEKILSPQERKKIAEEHFRHWFNKANYFFADYKSNLKKAQNNDDLLPQAAFHLHQVAESCYKAILLVFSNYTPREHFLEILGKEAEKYCPQLKNIFPKSTKEDKDRFKLLDYAYIGGRYDPDYQISKKDLEILSISIDELLDTTQKSCSQKIKDL